ncbi:MAG TPA: hypothetical protein VF054_11165 [Micromonosporaceae bacterium]
MRRVAGVVIGAAALAFGIAVPAAAAPAGPATACTVKDDQVANLSGLVATASGYVAVSGRSSDGTTPRVFVLDGSCRRQRTVSYPSQPLDPEDVVAQPDGTLWIADIGDTDKNRPWITLWKAAANLSKMTRYRFTYPDKQARDAEAIVLNGNGMPIVVTKVANGPAELYTPAAAPDANATGGVPLKKVGEFHPVRTNTPNQFGVVGQNTVTGGANSPDGKRVVLRTYSDAYEWDVAGGDAVAAITQGKPRITPLPNESRGEAITYTHDGSAFLTVPRDGAAKILRYTPSTSDQPPPTKAASAPGASGGSFWKKLTLKQLTVLVAAVGVLGLLMVVGGVLGIRYARAHPPTPRDSVDVDNRRRRRRHGERTGDWSDDDEFAGGEPGVYGSAASARGRVYSAPGYTEPGYDPGYQEPPAPRRPRQRYDSNGYDDYREQGYREPAHPEPGYPERGYEEPGYPPPRPRGREYRGGRSDGYDEPYADRYGR